MLDYTEDFLQMLNWLRSKFSKYLWLQGFLLQMGLYLMFPQATSEKHDYSTGL